MASHTKRRHSNSSDDDQELSTKKKHLHRDPSNDEDNHSKDRLSASIDKRSKVDSLTVNDDRKQVQKDLVISDKTSGTQSSSRTHIDSRLSSNRKGTVFDRLSTSTRQTGNESDKRKYDEPKETSDQISPTKKVRPSDSPNNDDEQRIRSYSDNRRSAVSNSSKSTNNAAAVDAEDDANKTGVTSKSGVNGDTQFRKSGSIHDRLSRDSSTASDVKTSSTNRHSRAPDRDHYTSSKRAFSASDRRGARGGYHDRSRRDYSCPVRLNKPVAFGYGDSFIGTLTLVDQTVLQVMKFKGASAKGLNNPHSTLGIGNKLITMLNRNKPAHTLLVFGNVDLHINFIYQLQTKGEKAVGSNEFKTNVFNQYKSFIENNILKLIRKDDQRNEGFIETLLISSVIMPVVEDKYLELSVRKYTEKEIKDDLSSNENIVSVQTLLDDGRGCDLETRRRMVTEFNELLRDWCSKFPKVTYIDINQYIMDPSTSIVKSEYLDKDPTNIHILWEPTIGFWLREMKNHGISGVDESHIESDLEKSLQSYKIEKRQRMAHHPITSHLLKDQQ